jgi:hypothetical protein
MNGTLVVVCLVFVIFVLAIIYVNRNTTESFISYNYYAAVKNGLATSDYITTKAGSGITPGVTCWITDKYRNRYKTNNNDTTIVQDANGFRHCNQKGQNPTDYRFVSNFK